MPDKKPEPANSSFASRKVEREAVEAVDGPQERQPRTLRAGLDVEQPVITVVRR